MSSVKVAVRVRPLNSREKDLSSEPIIHMVGKKTIISNPKATTDVERVKEFTFDHSYWSVDENDVNFASQEQVFQDLGQDIVADALQGYNSCIFAYGQTGSGKTHTMMGSNDCEGLIPKICRRLFQQINSLASHEDKSVSYKTEISYLEIYNEQVRDLLENYSEDVNGNHRALKVREHQKLGPYVENLSKHSVHSYGDILELMRRGNFNRTTASTRMNDTSSRSHAIFIISFSKASFIANVPYETVSKINLVDLAGSERASSTQATGQRLVEGSHINKSLVTLGSVISVLAERSKKTATSPCTPQRKSTFIPYRDSILTWLLKDSLGGNSKTIMIATISPADCNYYETLNTLRYANRAKNIMNKPHINEDPNTKLIRELRDEIERLKSKIGQNPLVQERLEVNEAKVKELTQRWISKWDDIKEILTEQEAIGIRKSGNSGVILDSDLPHLILCIDDDLLSTGVALFQLKKGRTHIGTKFAQAKQDIVINPGRDVENEHCFIEWDNSREDEDGEANISLHPINGALCFVNQNVAEQPIKLHQGCLIVLGENNMFRFNNPREVKNIKDKSTITCTNTATPDSLAVLKQRNTRLISSTTSFDSMYNSISSLNNKKLINSSLGLDEEDEDGKERQPRTASNRFSVYSNDTIHLAAQQEELGALTSILQELRGILENNDKPMETSSSSTSSGESNESLQAMLANLVGQAQSNHEEAVNILRTIQDKDCLQKLHGMINDRMYKLECSLTEDMFNNNSTEAHRRRRSETKQTLEASVGTCNSLYGSPVLPSNILDELVQVEVERRMQEHMEQCECASAARHLGEHCPGNKLFVSALACPEPDQVMLHIPSFYLQYLPDKHVVYEIKIRINNVAWTIYRRYSCFLTFHKQVRTHYGRAIEMPQFPSKHLFSRNRFNDKFVEQRRRLLENYVQRVIEQCKVLDECPLNFRKRGLEHLTRECLYKFSDFFIVNTLVDHVGEG